VGDARESGAMGDQQQTVSEMWVVGVAVTISAILRWNVDRVHEEDRNQTGLAEAVAKTGGAVREAYMRYNMGLLPLKRSTHTRYREAEEVCRHWLSKENIEVVPEWGKEMRVGFFDGGRATIRGQGGADQWLCKGCLTGKDGDRYGRRRQRWRSAKQQTM
jgi:hypothetical protein